MTQELKEFLDREGYSSVKELPEVGVCGICRFLFTTGLVIGIDMVGYKGRYCYSLKKDALDALAEWDGKGDPPGPWIKYKGEGGERSNPNTEHI